MSKGKKLIFMAIGIILLVAAVIGVTKYNEYQASLEPEESSSSVVLKNLLENDKSNIQSINLLTQEDSITLVPIGVNTSSGIIEWGLEGHEDWTLKHTHSNIVSMASLFQVYKEIETNVTDEARLDEFGLKNPSSVVTITLKDGTVQKIKIGDLSSDQKYTFCQMEGDDTVYACNATYSEYAHFTKQTIRLNVIQNEIHTDDDLTYLFMQRKGMRPVEIEYDESALSGISTQADAYLMFVYKFKEPYTASYINVRKDILDGYYKNLTTPEVVETIDADCQDLDKYGVGEEPEFHEKITSTSKEKEEFTSDYYFGYTYGENDEYMYFREGDSNMVLGIKADCMSVRNFEPFSFVNKLVYLRSITDIQSGSITIDGKTHEFTIKRQDVSEEESVAAEDVLTVYRVDGKLVDNDAFQNAYRTMISVAPDYEIMGEIPDYDPSDMISMTFHYNNGGEETVTYYRLSEFYYVTAADDDIWFACSDAYFDDIVEALNACLETMEEG